MAMKDIDRENRLTAMQRLQTGQTAPAGKAAAAGSGTGQQPPSYGPRIPSQVGLIGLENPNQNPVDRTQATTLPWQQSEAPAETTTAPAQTAPTFSGTYDDQLRQLYDQIVNREDFNYNVNVDPLYQQYKDQYIQGGKLAMKDTMGQAAGLTGGYGSTYSQAAGQQAYDAYLQNLTDKVPELYDMAYGMYKDKGDQMLQQYSMLNDLNSQEYNRYRDEMSDYFRNQEFAAQQQQQAYVNLLALIESTKGKYNPTDEEIAAAGLTREAVDALLAKYQKKKRKGGGGGGGTPAGGDTETPGAAAGSFIGAIGVIPASESKAFSSDEVREAANYGVSRTEVESALKNRGVNTRDPSVRKELDKAFGK